jgi:predicted TIM-barrel fold metal-dependent hydrolase
MARVTSASVRMQSKQELKQTRAFVKTLEGVTDKGVSTMSIRKAPDRNEALGADQDRLLVISADTHIGPRPQELRPYCPKKYLEAYDAFNARWGKTYNELFEMRAFSAEYWVGRCRNIQTLGHYDPQAWLGDMDHDGVAGGIVFPDSLNGQVFPFDLTNSIGNGTPAPEARELAAVGRAMYNRWLVDFCKATGGRALGLAQIPLWDLDASMKELDWCAAQGLGGVSLPTPGDPGMQSFRDPALDRFFAACAANDMTLSTHIGALPPQTDYGDPTGEETFHFGLLDSGEWGMRTIYQLVIFGAFDRHPKLKFVLTEVPGVYWDEISTKMNSIHNSPIRRKDNKTSSLPSDYLASNVWMGNSFQSRQEAQAAIEIGRANRFMWGSDYPHAEGTFIHPNSPSEYSRTRLSLAYSYHGLPLDKVRMLLGENAIDAYPRLDTPALRQAASRIGVRVSEIETAPELSNYADIVNTGTLAFRTEGPWS